MVSKKVGYISGNIPHPVSQPAYLAAPEGVNLICPPFSLVCPVNCFAQLAICQSNEAKIISLYYIFSFNGDTP